MNLQEAQARLKKSTINEEQLQQISPLYILLDIDKDDFCKIVDTIGLETLLHKSAWYERLLEAENELSAKERYLKAKNRLYDLEDEKRELTKEVEAYEKNIKKLF